MSDSYTRKSCVVPKCKNTLTKTPEKLFFVVPKDIKIRKKWIKSMKRLDPFGDKSNVYCCEDHFDIENDMENYIKYKQVGGKLLLKKGIVPHKFKCQEEDNDKPERSAAKKQMPPVLCRICLATDVHMHSIHDTPLQAVYEKLTNTLLNTTDLKPVSVCYICYVQLKKCYKVMQTAVRTENMLTYILSRHPEANKSSEMLLTLVKRESNDNSVHGTLTTSPVMIETIETLSFSTPMVIKDEPNHDEVIVKQEIDYEEYAVSLNEYYTCTLEEDNSEMAVKDEDPLNRIYLEQECYGQLQNEPVEAGDWQDTTISDDTCLYKELQKPKQDKSKSRIRQKKSKPAKNYFECDQCQQGFLQKCRLEAHMRVHKQTKQFQCDICQRRLSYKHSFDRHMRTHTGDKPYVCSYCPKRFSNSAVMKIHIRTHTGEQPYKCEVCDRRFKQQHDMKRHARIHTGEKPYKCDICQRRFNEKCKAVRHLKTHDAEKLTGRD